MKLTYRKAEYEDAIASFDLVKHYYSDIDQHKDLPELWRKWMSEGAMLGCVVEDADQTIPSRIVAHGMVVLLSDEFADDVLANPHPYIAERLVRESLQGKTHVLNANEIARANAGNGINILNIHSGVRDLSSETPLYHPVIDQLHSSYCWRFSGFYIRQQLQETLNHHMFTWVVSNGYLLRSDFEAFYRDNPDLAVNSIFRRSMVGITREEALEYPGSRAFLLYTYPKPKLRLSPKHQSLLEYAILGENDEYLAKHLWISVSAVKKRWLAIYDSVSAVDPTIFGDTENRGSNSESRGTEKRRHLLRYLSQHPEELKPYEQ